MRHYLAIDGGNSKTDVMVGAEDGRVLAFARGPGSSPDWLGIEGSLAVLDALIRPVLAEARRSVAAAARRHDDSRSEAPASRHDDSRGRHDPSVTIDLLVAYLAGVDLPIEVERYAKAVGDVGWATENVVDNDLFALLRAGTADPDAIAVICGAGINCVGRRADGRTARFPALGSLTGDWGGGHHLADLTLWHAARGEDGRGPATALSRAVAEHFGSARVEDVSAAMHLRDIPRSRIEELTPVLFDVAEAGDEVARSVVAKQAREIVLLARIAAERLDLLDEPHTIVLGGGVLTARRPLLHGPVVAGLATAAPRATIEIVHDGPIAGGALLALDQWGTVTPQTDATVRFAVADRIAALGR
jgi:N-acetylglucosamine kinase-like BadF-type ATPase